MDRESLARLICESIERHERYNDRPSPEDGDYSKVWVGSDTDVAVIDMLAVADDVLAAMSAALPTARISPGVVRWPDGAETRLDGLSAAEAEANLKAWLAAMNASNWTSMGTASPAGPPPGDNERTDLDWPR